MRLYVEDRPKVPQKDINALIEAYGYMEKFLSKQPYLAGEHLTIADLCCICTLTCGGFFAPVSEDDFPNLTEWIKKMEALPYYQETNGKPNADYFQFLEGILLQKNRTTDIEVTFY